MADREFPAVADRTEVADGTRTGFSPRDEPPNDSEEAVSGPHESARVAVRRTARDSVNTRLRFQAILTSVHSSETAFGPRLRNPRNPSTDLMMRNTGSRVLFRSPYTALPDCVMSRCCIVVTGRIFPPQ